MYKNYFQLVLISFAILFAKLAAQSISLEEHSRLEIPGAIESYIIDMDNDGYEDILSASLSKEIIMWKGDGNLNFSPVVLSGGIDVARGIRGGDINGDGLNDVVIASFNNNKVKILLNNGNGFETFVLDSNYTYAHTPSLNDLDGDGDIDVVCSAFNTVPDAGKICWWENKGEMTFVKHTLSTTFNSATILTTDDIDGDEDFDILVCSESLGEVVWWQNDGNGTFAQNVIDDNFTFAHTANSVDVDKDGDKDIVGCSYETGNLFWWQNDGSQNFIRISIGNIQEALWINSFDLDDDGDNDLIATGGEGAFWFENDGALNFTKMSLPGAMTGGYYLTASDLDDDTDFDIIAGSNVSGKVIVWRNTLYNIDCSAVPVTGNKPLNVMFTDESYGLSGMESLEWDFDNDGTIDSYEQNPEWIYNEPGTYDVRCKISFGQISKTILKRNIIKVFDGESSIEFETDAGYASIQSDAQLNLNTQFTIELHIYPVEWGIDTYGSTLFDKNAIKLGLLGKGFGPRKSHGILVTLKNASGSDIKFSSPDSVYILNRWQHMALTFDQLNNELKLYINGYPAELIQIGSGSFEEGLLDNQDTPILLGKDQNEEYGYSGSIDELRIWNVIRSENEISEYAKNHLNGNEPGLTAYFKMNEGNGKLLIDELNNYEGALTNANYSYGVDFTQITNTDYNINTTSLPHEFRIEQNYPNPFNPSTRIDFSLSSENFVTLSVFNLLGQKVSTLVQENKPAGQYSVSFNASELPSGVYFYQLKAGSNIKSKKMELMK